MLLRSPMKGTPKKKPRERHVQQHPGAAGLSTLAPLPTELMHHILMLVLDMAGSLRPMALLPQVSFHWWTLTQSPVLWEFVCKRHFVCYSMVQQLRTVPIHAQELEFMPSAVAAATAAVGAGGVAGSNSSSHRRMSSFLARVLSSKPAGDTIEPPTSHSVFRYRQEVGRFNAMRRYQELVARRRTFVIHAFLSLTLLLFSCAMLAAMCAAEGLDPITVCNSEVAFSFLWLTYVGILGIVVSNIVMEAHFEPRPLLTRLRMHTKLIFMSTVALLGGVVFVVLPTRLVQENFREKTRSWLSCVLPIVTALQLWQVEVWYVTQGDFLAFLRNPRLVSLRTLYHTVTYMTPTMFTGSIVALATHLDGPPNPLLLVLGCLPLGLTFFTLSVVFFLDFTVWNRTSDLIAAASMGISNIFCLLIMFTEWRGVLMLPLVLGCFSFFLGHFHELRKMIDAEMTDPEGDQVLFVDDE